MSTPFKRKDTGIVIKTKKCICFSMSVRQGTFQCPYGTRQRTCLKISTQCSQVALRLLQGRDSSKESDTAVVHIYKCHLTRGSKVTPDINILINCLIFHKLYFLFMYVCTQVGSLKTFILMICNVIVFDVAGKPALSILSPWKGQDRMCAGLGSHGN